MLSSRSFRALHSTFRFVIHFELMFVNGVRSVSRFIFLYVDVHLSYHHLLKKLSLFHLLLCQRSVDHIFVGPFLGCLLCFTDLFVYSFANTTLPFLL